MDPADLPGRSDRPVVLLSLGTVVDDWEVLTRAVAAVAALDVNVLVAPHQPGDLDLSRVDADRVRVTGFVPMANLLEAADLVVSAGGAGTVLSTLAAGLPMVLLPLGLDKPVNADRAASIGAAHVVSGPVELGDAVAKVLADGMFRASAQAMAGEIAAINSPSEVLRELVDHLS